MFAACLAAAVSCMFEPYQAMAVGADALSKRSSCLQTQALQRARGTPGFAQRAAQAQQAYQEQAQRAARAVGAWASQHGFEIGTELRWCVRS